MAKDTNNYKIFSELDELESSYMGSSLEKVPGLRRSQYQVIKMCEYYSDSRYLGTYIGNKKRIGDGEIDVPFNNIVNYRVALAKTATDLDIKDFQIVADNPKYEVHSMLLNREAYEWMKKAEFSRTLNQMGHTRPKYGGYLIKKVEKGGELNIEVVRWTNAITNQNDILAGPIVERHHMSPVEITKKAKVWDNTTEVLKAFKAIKAKDRPAAIEVYEILGEFPKMVYNDAINKEDIEGVKDEDTYTYSLQRYFVAKVDKVKFKMYAEELPGEITDYYEYLSWEDNGFGLGRGVIEDCEEAQVWTNDATIEESIAMKLAGRVGIKTNSKKLGQNVLEHDHGKLYKLDANEDINAFSLSPSALGQYQNIIDRWKGQGDNVTQSYNATTGEQPPANTPYSQTALLNQVATKPFDYKREEWGIHLTKIFDKWVIPFLIKKINKEHILISDFTDEELDVIDESFATYHTNKDIVDAVLDELEPTKEDQRARMEGYKSHIKKQGKKRYIKIPKDYFKDIECKVTVLTTGEQKNKAVILQSISELMQTAIQSWNPQTGEFGVLADPFLSKLFREAVEIAGTGISPVSLGIGKGAMPSKSPVATPPNTPTPSPVQPIASQPLATQQ